MTKNQTPVYTPTAEDWAEFSKWVESTPEWKMQAQPKEEEEERQKHFKGLTSDRGYILPKRNKAE